jgi:hypothetical protein
MALVDGQQPRLLSGRLGSGVEGGCLNFPSVDRQTLEAWGQGFTVDVRFSKRGPETLGPFFPEPHHWKPMGYDRSYLACTIGHLAPLFGSH